jgi:ATP phosphoribosyltransferase regulatory subunit
MSKFEEYDFYAQNKDFLVSDSIITFNDTDGALLALKPDVTLSIIKNSTLEPGMKKRVYYDENVYRVSGSTHRYKEIMQTGLECVGDIDIYDKFEAVYLAAKSLSVISPEFVIDLSHMGIFSSVVDSASESRSFKRRALILISEKNLHELKLLCSEYEIESTVTSVICELATLYGAPDKVIERLRKLPLPKGCEDAVTELSEICALLLKTEFYGRIRIDFSVLGDMNYYNGIVFSGFLSGICEGVLTGGEYQALMSKLKRRGSGVGFAIYLDLLSSLSGTEDEFDGDVFLLYSCNTGSDKLFEKKEELVKAGLRTSSGTAVPSDKKYKEIINLS